MTVYTDEIRLKTNGEIEIIDISADVKKAVKKSKIKNGMGCVFVPGSTGAITTIEYEPGLLEDFPNALNRIFPRDIEYKHHLRWHDGNGHSHVRASFIGPSMSFPVINGEIPLGTWQQIVFVELDVRSRDRRVIIQIVGE